MEQPSPEHQICQKCSFYKTANRPFQDGFWVDFEKNEVGEGLPPTDRDFLVIIGDTISKEADEEGVAERSDDALTLIKGFKKNGIQRIWYHPGICCRPPLSEKGSPKLLDKPEIKRCFTHFISQRIEAINPKVIVAAGPVAGYSVLGRMDSRQMEGRALLYKKKIPAFSLRDVESVQIGESQKEAFYDRIKTIAKSVLDGSYQRDIIRPIDYITAWDEETLLDWFAPVFENLHLPLFWDIETSGLSPFEAGYKVGLFSFYHPCQKQPLMVATPDFKASFERYGQDTGRDSSEWPEVWEKKLLPTIKMVLKSPKIKKCGHNAQFDEVSIKAALNLDLDGYYADTMIWNYLIHPDEKSLSGLEDLVRKYAPEIPEYWEELSRYREENKIDNYLELPWEILVPYAAYDTFSLWPIFKKIRAKIIQLGKEDYGGFFIRAMESVEASRIPTYTLLQYAEHGRKVHQRVCTMLEINGQHIDFELLAKIRVQYEQERSRHDEKLQAHPSVQDFCKTYLGEHSGKSTEQHKVWKRGGIPTINWGSVNQVRMFFINYLKLSTNRRTDKGNPSMDEGALVEFSGQHESAKILLDWRRVDKFITSFLDPITDGRVVWADKMLHSRFKPSGTETSRLATCVAHDSKVFTNRGYVRIDEVQPGDLALTHTGSFRKIVAVSIIGYEPTYKLTTIDGRSIKATSGHRVFHNGTWKSIGSLRRGDKITCFRGEHHGTGKTAEEWQEAGSIPNRLFQNSVERNVVDVTDKGGWLVTPHDCKQQPCIQTTGRMASEKEGHESGVSGHWEGIPQDTNNHSRKKQTRRIGKKGPEAVGDCKGTGCVRLDCEKKLPLPRTGNWQFNTPYRYADCHISDELSRINNARNCGGVQVISKKSGTILRNVICHAFETPRNGVGGKEIIPKTRTPPKVREYREEPYQLELESSGSIDVYGFINGWYSPPSPVSNIKKVQSGLLFPGKELSDGDKWNGTQILGNKGERQRETPLDKREWIQTSSLHLSTGDEISQFLCDDTVTSIEFIGFELIYDCSIDVDQSYVTEGGIISHNSAPNVQAIPRSGNVKKLYNSRFQNGWMATRDYSGLEVRIMAAISQDENLVRIFNEGGDAHFYTQQHFFAEKANKSDKDQRSICKRALFGKIYGQGDKGLWELLLSEGVKSPTTGEYLTLEECAEFNQMLATAYPKVEKWCKLTHSYGSVYAWISSPFGFIRPMEALKDYETYQNKLKTTRWEELKKSGRFQKLKMAIFKDFRRCQNTPIQSSAGDLTVFAAHRIAKMLKQSGLNSILTNIVHDDIWIDVFDHTEVKPVSRIMKTVMDHAPDWLPDELPGYNPSWMTVPIIGEGDIGINPMDAYKAIVEPYGDHDDLILKVPDIVGKSITGTETNKVAWNSDTYQAIRESLELVRLKLD